MEVDLPILIVVFTKVGTADVPVVDDANPRRVDQNCIKVVQPVIHQRE